MAEENKSMTTREAAAFLGSTISTLESWRHRGSGPAYMKQGRSVRYRLKDLIQFQEQNLVTPQGKGLTNASRLRRLLFLQDY